MDAWGGAWGNCWGGAWGGTAAPVQPPATGGAGHWPRRRRTREDAPYAARELQAPHKQPPELAEATVAAAEFAALAINALRAIPAPEDLVRQWNLDALQRELLALTARQDAAVQAAAQALQAQQQRAVTDDELALLLLLSH